MPGHGHIHSVRCPHCHAEFSATVGRSNDGGKRRWRAGLLVLGLLVLGCLAVSYRYRGQIVTVFDLINEATGSTSVTLAAFALAALAAACIAAWLLLPILIAWAYLDLRGRLGCTRSCACPSSCAGPASEPPASAVGVPTPPPPGSPGAGAAGREGRSHR